MTTNDLNQISKLLDEKLTTTKRELTAGIQTELTASIKTELTASIDEKLIAAEKRLRTEMIATEKRLKDKITDSGNNIIEEIAGFMEINIIPKLEGKTNKSDIERVERRTDSLADKVGEHDVRLKKIESIPAITHQLKVKRTK